MRKLRRSGRRYCRCAGVLFPLLLALIGCAQGAERAPGESEADWGGRIFQKQGCTACHSLDGVLLQGPPVGQVWLGEVKLRSGEVTVRDEDYLRRSILEPLAEVREGFFPVMVPYPHLTEEQVDALVAFVKQRSVPASGAMAADEAGSL